MNAGYAASLKLQKIGTMRVVLIVVLVASSPTTLAQLFVEIPPQTTLVQTLGVWPSMCPLPNSVSSTILRTLNDAGTKAEVVADAGSASGPAIRVTIREA